MYPPRALRPDGRSRRGRLVALLAVPLLAVPLLTGAASPDGGDIRSETTPGTAFSSGLDAGSYTTTLITGDQVTLDVELDGRLAVGVVPADRDGVEVGFESIESGDDFYVLPQDAALLVPEQLDLELFNVTRLVRSGYHADGAGQLPVIVTYADDRSGARATPLPHAIALPSIAGAAAALDREAAEAFWQQAAVTTTRAAASPGTLPGVEKIWLDELLEVTLDESVPLVGAPVAWDAGYDGDGVTLAVLDTGVDANHPDLAGQVIDAQNFTTDPDAGDDHGHGTHVASIAAGTGAGSDGARTGVAPGASVVNAKVCNQFGNCATSAIIAGMEWVAADLGVEVANLSVGTNTASDGTDLVSQAVNQLTDQYGTLFVIAAGNAGPRASTVGSPGAADAALTVGSVSKAEQLASSSSRGPRLRDFAIKPDVTAPGVNIVAARAAGTSLGTPVDDLYTQVSGTSMATPHVAGAAAILRQQNPGLAAGDVKAALASTGAPHTSLSVYQQGGGRIDIAAAIDAPVLATPAPLDIGYFPFPQDDGEPVTREVTYTNRTDDDLTLTLSTEVTDENGNPPADGMLSLGSESVTVPAGGTATVDVTVDVDRGEFGLYGGYLIAEHAGEAIARTPVGFFKEDERYEVLVRAIDTEGNPADGGLTVMNVEDQAVFFELTVNFDAAGEARLRVPPGTYAAYGFANTLPEGEIFATAYTAVAEPELEVTDDVEVIFDARTANPITVDAPAHDVGLDPGRRQQLSLTRRPAIGLGATRSLNAFTKPFNAAPTVETSIGLFELNISFRLTEAGDPAGTSVLYHVVIPEVGSIPETLDYVVRPDQLGISHQEFYNHLPDHSILGEFRHWWRPWQNSSLAINEPVTPPVARTEYLAPADAVSWTRSLLFAPPGVSSAAARMNAPRMEYQPGEQETRTWMKQPVKPGLIEGSPWHPTFPQFREGDILDLLIPEFSDSQRGHWSFYSGSIDEAAFRLYENGELIAETVRALGEFTLSPEPSRVRMELDVSRDQDWWLYSTHTTTAWEFESEHASGDPVIIPILLVDYDVNLDLLNTALHPSDRSGPNTVDLQVRHQPGFDGLPAPGRPAIAGVRAWISYDDGDTWRPRPVRDLGGGHYQAILDARDPDETNGYVALRVEAWDADGNRIEQEITRAWGLPPR